MARAPRTSEAEEEQAQSVAEIEALVNKLPVTGCDGGTPPGGPPVDVQISVRDEALGLFERGAATPEAANRLWARLPSYWRRQFAPSQLPDVDRMRAIDPDSRDFHPRRIGGSGRSSRA